MNSRANALSRLFHLAPRGADLGLPRMREACARFGHPERAFQAVHIAGTNGKGSVSAMLATMLHASGRRVGLYTSPHLCRFAERIRIGNEPIEDEKLYPILDEVLDEAPELTFFEAATLTAFLAFARNDIGIAVIEVGLGGRLDATNVLPSPLATAITRIAKDHKTQLGDSLAGIAREKAGILKASIPVVLGPLPSEARDAVLEVAHDIGAPVVFADTKAKSPLLDDRIALSGAHQRDNAAIALSLASLLGLGDEAISQGLREVKWPGRLERIENADCAFLLDCAHNPDGAQSLAEYLRASGHAPSRIALVFGAMADKDWAGMLSVLAPLANTRIYVTPGGREPVTTHELVEGFGGMAAGSLQEALAQARDAVGKEGLVVVAGSIFLVGEARATLLGIDRDPAVAL